LSLIILKAYNYINISALPTIRRDYVHLSAQAFALAHTLLLTSATPTNSKPYAQTRPSDATIVCTDFKVPLTVTSTNLVLNITTLANNFEVVDFLTDFTRIDSKTAFNPIGGIKNETANYFISGTFCTPKISSGNGHEKIVLLATHGLGYDRRYWDSAYKAEQYSFVKNIVGKGFSVFFYDTLGIGES